MMENKENQKYFDDAFDHQHKPKGEWERLYSIVWNRFKRF